MRKTHLFEDYYDIESVQKCDAGKLLLPIGISENGELEEFEASVWDRLPHVLVSGGCGSGKSTLLRVLISSLLLNFSHEQVNIWLCESKGYEFQPFRDATPPHITCQWRGGSREENVTFLNVLNEEFARRKHELIENGSPSFAEYVRNNSSGKMPRLVVLIDGFDFLIRDLCEQDYSNKMRMSDMFREAFALGVLFVVTAQDVFYSQFISPSDFAVYISMKQSENSIREQYYDPDAVALASQLNYGEALANVPDVHKVNLLYLSREVERRIIEKISASTVS